MAAEGSLSLLEWLLSIITVVGSGFWSKVLGGEDLLQGCSVVPI